MHRDGMKTDIPNTYICLVTMYCCFETPTVWSLDMSCCPLLKVFYKDDLNWLKGIGCFVWDTPEILRCKRADKIQSEVSWPNLHIFCLQICFLYKCLRCNQCQASELWPSCGSFTEPIQSRRGGEFKKLLCSAGNSNLWSLQKECCKPEWCE